jgi:hypothetical protein
MQRVRNAFLRISFWLQAWKTERVLTLARADAEIGMLNRLQGARR